MPPPPLQRIATQELVAAAPSACPGGLEEEVVFDRFCVGLLRSVVSFSLSEHTSLNPEERVVSKQHQRRQQAAFRVLAEQDQCCLRLPVDGALPRNRTGFRYASRSRSVVVGPFPRATGPCG